MTRILTALVAVPLLLALILFAPAWTFLLLGLAVALQGYREMETIAKAAGWDLLPVGYGLTLLVTASFYPGAPGLGPLALGLAAMVGGAAAFFRRPGGETLGAVGLTLLAVLYIGGPLASIVGLRVLAPGWDGRLWVIFLLAVVMIGDAGAFFTGKSFGRHRLAPELSPKKTLEGLAGGLAASVLTAVVLKLWMLPQLSLLSAAALGLVLALLGVVGDLFESLLKRSVELKDTASLLPGHGGILDRIDSLLFAAPALFVYLTSTL